MLDYNQTLYAQLSKIANTVPEITITSNQALPCITYKKYLEQDVETTTDGSFVTNVKYQIKVFIDNGADYGILTRLSAAVDKVMKENGFIIDTCEELATEDCLQCIMRFSGNYVQNIKEN